MKQSELQGAVTLYSATMKEYSDEQQRLLRECAAVLTNLLPLHSASVCSAGTISVQPGSQITSELTH